MLVDRAAEAFETRFGAKPTLFSFAPGRVNLIGEHTDYNDGFVFPVAIQHGIAVAARPTDGPSKLYSVQEGEGQEFTIKELDRLGVQGWTAYPAGVAWAMRESGFDQLPNIEAAVFGDLPRASGLSSSAAIELAFCALWNEDAGGQLSRIEMAQTCQRAENDFVGMRCGIMDQLASAMGKHGKAMFVDTRSLDVRYAEVPSHLRIVVCDTLAPRQLAESAYNDRRRECEEAAKALGVVKLRDADLDVLLERQAEMDPTVFKRARHVVTENTRCQGFFWALADDNPLRIGLLMQASHESLREDFEVTGKELDTMAEACWSAPGCMGARMTGAGFGGCCVALVEGDRIDSFVRSVSHSYRARIGSEPRFFVCEPSDGAATVWR